MKMKKQPAESMGYSKDKVMRKVYRYECLQHKKKEISNKKPK
jgi:hypothetical protein